MRIHIELDETAIKELIIQELKRRVRETAFDVKNLTIQVKSKQNWKSEWETAAFIAVYDHREAL